MVLQPTVVDTISILRGLKEKYEIHHGVRITDAALVSAATLSHRYISERFLPDKAIDLVDEAAAKLKIEVTSKPQAIDELDRRIIQLQMERLSVARDEKEGSPRIAGLDKQIQALQREQEGLRSRWELERAGVTRLQDLKNQIDSIQTQIAKAEREYDLNTAAVLKYGSLPELQKQLKQEEDLYATMEANKATTTQMIRDTVGEDDIADIVSKWTGIPVSKLMEGEMQKLLKLQDELDKKVIGQRDATQVVAEAIQRSRAGLSDPSKPIATLAFLGPTGSFISLFLPLLSPSSSPSSCPSISPSCTCSSPPLRFCSPLSFMFNSSGNLIFSHYLSSHPFFHPHTPTPLHPTTPPSGVGKTELCKALASFLFDSEDAVVRIDMSEYMESHSVSRLVGAPPGYVGFEDGGQLTEAVRRKPYAVVLFDEMEKAHPDVFNILLQLLDDGRLTDSKGNVVNFRNTIVIFTSNIGSQDILGMVSTADHESVKQRVMDALRAKFRPEFLNRIDEFVTFNSLGLEQLVPIVSLELDKVAARLTDRKLSLSVTDGAKQWLAEVGFDPSYGARPLKRTIQREVETPVAKGILAGKYPSGSTILIDAVPGDAALTISTVIDVQSEATRATGAVAKRTDDLNVVPAQ